MDDQPYLFPPSPEELTRVELDPAQAVEILEAGGGPGDIVALERLRDKDDRNQCRLHVLRFRRCPGELATIEGIARRFLAAMDARGRRDLVSWLDLCGELKLEGVAMDHDHKRFLLWVLKQRGGPMAGRLAVHGEEFRALAAAGWKEQIGHE